MVRLAVSVKPGVLDGLEYGLNFPALKPSFTSRKLTTFLFSSTVIFRSSFANFWHVCVFAFSISLGV